jgi:hypothetical protein
MKNVKRSGKKISIGQNYEIFKPFGLNILTECKETDI